MRKITLIILASSFPLILSGCAGLYTSDNSYEEHYGYQDAEYYNYDQADGPRVYKKRAPRVDPKVYETMGMKVNDLLNAKPKLADQKTKTNANDSKDQVALRTNSTSEGKKQVQ